MECRRRHGAARAVIATGENIMMHFSDETLLAFADGTLDAASRRAIEEAVLQDPAIAQRVAQRVAQRNEHKQSKEESSPARAGAPVQEEPAPRAAMRGGTVVQLAAVRANRAQAANKTQPRLHAPGQTTGAAIGGSMARWSWPQWGALAATLLVGIFVGRFALLLSDGEPSLLGIAPGNGGVLSARGKLARALTDLDAGAAGSGIEIGSSFVSKEGGYCRSFALAGTARAQLTGLACRSGSVWNVAAISDDPMSFDAPASADGHRAAGAAMPAAIGAAIEQRIAGSALDASAVRDALRRGWRR
jgi:hypothetical protein